MKIDTTTTHTTLRVALFALTGFGNEAIDVLLEESCSIAFIVTRKEVTPFPYYEVEELDVHGVSKGIPVFVDPGWDDVAKRLKEEHIDLLLVSTFHRIVPNHIIESVPLAVNIHPSLLPAYRGRRPVEAVLAAGETKTGVTAHLLTERVDAGDIIIQKSLPILPEDTANSMRKKLASLSGTVIRELISQIRNQAMRFTPQRE